MLTPNTGMPLEQTLCGEDWEVRRPDFESTVSNPTNEGTLCIKLQKG